MIKTTIQLCKCSFSIKLTKLCKENQYEMFCTFAGITSLTPHVKLCNLWKLIKTPKNFAQGSFSIKSLKLCHKNRNEFWPQVPFKPCVEKMKYKFPTMTCCIITDQALLCTQPEGWYMSGIVYSETALWKYTGCYCNIWLYSFKTRNLSVSMRKMSWL